MTYVRHKSNINGNQSIKSLGYNTKITRSLQELGVDLDDDIRMTFYKIRIMTQDYGIRL